MYRISCVLSKPKILSSRYHPTHTRKFLEKYGSVIKNNSNNYGRHMSTSAEANTKQNRLYWGYSAVTLILVGTSVTLISKYNDEFRRAVEDAIPFVGKAAFDFLIPRKTDLIQVEEAEDLPSEVVVEQQDDEGEVEEKTSPSTDDDVLVVNIMDTPCASAIDFEVGNKHEAVTDPIHEILVEGEHVLEELIHDVEEESLEQIVEDVVEVIVEIAAPELEGVLDIVEELADSPVVEPLIHVAEEAVIEYIEEEVVELAESILTPTELLEESTVELTDEPPIVETPVLSEVVEQVVEEVVNEEQLNTVLSNAYENLRIILDDTVTTKTSAAGMLHGYITQFCQALLISKDDPAYDSIWEAAAVLENNVKESVDLVKVKETEANSQMKQIAELIQVIRTFGVSNIADKAEALIATSSETLVWGESEIEIASNKLGFLHDFQRRVEGSPQKLQEYLDDFKPDVIRLLNLQAFIDAQNLSTEDALLMLSLRRPELIYADVHEKEVEQKKQFEATMEQQKEDLLKEADENLKNMMQLLEANKENEIKLKVEELNEEHENHLQEELKIQSEANQQEREIAIATHGAELTAKHEEETSQKLKEQEKEHYYVVSKNLSSLKGIQSKIADVVELGNQQQSIQHLWVAAQALNTALSSSSDNGRTESLLPVISNVLQCNKDDDVLATIVASVSKDAADMGVIPEEALIQRFNVVKRSCMRVANVKEDGSVLAYTFAYIKSLFVISRFYQRRITADIDLETIGPYEVLEKADYYIQQGDLVQAAKFMSLLKGVPKKLCADWLNEVRLLLETKQSANLLMAYAGSFIAG